MGKNKTGKYLKYAIGEIALVVIGILIALSINNWNEWRKERGTEREVLEDVANDLERNCEILVKVVEINDNADRSADLIISMIDQDQSVIDSLPTHLHFARLEATTRLSLSLAGYEVLKNQGFDIILSDTLKDAILDLYETSYPRMIKFADYVEGARLDRHKFINQHFITELGGLLTPIDLDELLDNINYFIFLKRLKQDRYAINNRAKNSLQKTQGVLQLIRDELGEFDGDNN